MQLEPRGDLLAARDGGEAPGARARDHQPAPPAVLARVPGLGRLVEQVPGAGPRRVAERQHGAVVGIEHRLPRAEARYAGVHAVNGSRGSGTSSGKTGTRSWPVSQASRNSGAPPGNSCHSGPRDSLTATVHSRRLAVDPPVGDVAVVADRPRQQPVDRVGHRLAAGLEVAQRPQPPVRLHFEREVPVLGAGDEQPQEPAEAAGPPLDRELHEVGRQRARRGRRVGGRRPLLGRRELPQLGEDVHVSG